MTKNKSTKTSEVDRKPPVLQPNLTTENQPHIREIDTIPSLIKQAEAESSIRSSINTVIRGMVGQFKLLREDPMRFERYCEELLVAAPRIADAAVTNSEGITTKAA